MLASGLLPVFLLSVGWIGVIICTLPKHQWQLPTSCVKAPILFHPIRDIVTSENVTWSVFSVALRKW
jgi:hypothetical protein